MSNPIKLVKAINVNKYITSHSHLSATHFIKQLYLHPKKFVVLNSNDNKAPTPTAV